MTHCNNITEFVKAFGGDRLLGEELGISKFAVMQWRLRNHIASGFHLRLLALAKRRGISVDPEVFGLNADDVKELFHNAPVQSDTHLHAVA